MSARCSGVDSEEIFEQGLEELEVEGVGAVGFGVGRIVMDFDEEAVDASCNSGAREQRNVLWLAPADAVGRGRLLHGVGGIENNGREPVHDGERAKVDDQVVVAESRAALGEEDAIIARGANLFKAVAHVPRGNELALLDVDGTPGFARGDQQIGLAAKKCGNLEDVDSFSGDFAVGRLVYIGEDGNAGVFRDAAKDARAFKEAGAAKAFYTGAIGLVVTGFEDEGNAGVGGDALHGFSD